MANYSPQHFEPRAKAVNVKGVANRAVATVLTAGLIAQPLMSPLAAIAVPSTDNGDSVQGGVPIVCQLGNAVFEIESRHANARPFGRWAPICSERFD